MSFYECPNCGGTLNCFCQTPAWGDQNNKRHTHADLLEQQAREIERLNAAVENYKSMWNKEVANTLAAQKEIEAEKLMSHTLRHHLMSAQAREVKYREALESCWSSSKSMYKLFNEKLVYAALAQPTDTSALDEYVRGKIREYVESEAKSSKWEDEKQVEFFVPNFSDELEAGK